MESIQSFAERCAWFMAPPDSCFEPGCYVDIQLVPALPAQPDISGTVLAGARGGELFLFTDGYPSGEDEDGHPVGYAGARILLFPAAHGHAEEIGDVVAKAGHSVTIRRVP